MLVSVLMLLVSVTTIADGNREVWEYWGGSCLCVYTGETEREESEDKSKAPITQAYAHPTLSLTKLLSLSFLLVEWE